MKFGNAASKQRCQAEQLHRRKLDESKSFNFFGWSLVVVLAVVEEKVVRTFDL